MTDREDYIRSLQHGSSNTSNIRPLITRAEQVAAELMNYSECNDETIDEAADLLQQLVAELRLMMEDGFNSLSWVYEVDHFTEAEKKTEELVDKMKVAVHDFYLGDSLCELVEPTVEMLRRLAYENKLLHSALMKERTKETT